MITNVDLLCEATPYYGQLNMHDLWVQETYGEQLDILDAIADDDPAAPVMPAPLVLFGDAELTGQLTLGA